MVNPDSEFMSIDGRCSLTRKEVADLLNQGVEDAEVAGLDDVAHFNEGDDRLTADVCVSFCNNMADFEDYLEATENVLSEFPQIRVR
jgi:hypothetical protein